MTTTVEIPEALRAKAQYDPAAHKGIKRADAPGKAAQDGNVLSIAADAALYSYGLSAYIVAECSIPAFGTSLTGLVESESGGVPAGTVFSAFGHPDSQKIFLGACLLYSLIGDGTHTDYLVRSPDSKSGDLNIPAHLPSKVSLYKTVAEWFKAHGGSASVALADFVEYLDEFSPSFRDVRKDVVERKTKADADKKAAKVTPTELKDNAPTATDWLRKAAKIVAGLNVDGHAEAWQEFVAAVEAKRKAVEATANTDEAPAEEASE